MGGALRQLPRAPSPSRRPMIAPRRRERETAARAHRTAPRLGGGRGGPRGSPVKRSGRRAMCRARRTPGPQICTPYAAQDAFAELRRRWREVDRGGRHRAARSPERGSGVQPKCGQLGFWGQILADVGRRWSTSAPTWPTFQLGPMNCGQDWPEFGPVGPVWPNLANVSGPTFGPTKGGQHWRTLRGKFGQAWLSTWPRHVPNRPMLVGCNSTPREPAWQTVFHLGADAELTGLAGVGFRGCVTSNCWAFFGSPHYLCHSRPLHAYILAYAQTHVMFIHDMRVILVIPCVRCCSTTSILLMYSNAGSTSILVYVHTCIHLYLYTNTLLYESTNTLRSESSAIRMHLCISTCRHRYTHT